MQFLLLWSPCLYSLVTRLLELGIDDTTLNCSAILDQAVANRDVRYVFTWQNRDGSNITSGGRATISSPSASHLSILTLSPLSTEDTGFTCTVRVTEVQNTLDASEPTVAYTAINVTSECIVIYVFIFLSIFLLAAPVDPEVEIVSSGDSIAGTTVIFTCTVSLLLELRGVPLIVWVGRDGMEIRNETAEDITVHHSFPPAAASLTFSPLRTGHGGEYRCRASVDIAEAGVFITNSLPFNITVQSQCHFTSS